MFFQFRDILVAAILAAPVRVMDETGCCDIANRCQRHPQGLQRVCRLQCGTYGPAYNLVRIGIRYEGQIAYSFICLHVCYVAYPYLIGTGWDCVGNKVWILTVVVS